jgi:hypothetical protein
MGFIGISFLQSFLLKCVYITCKILTLFEIFKSFILKKILACPFDLFIRKSSLRAFLTSMLIGIFYEYLLINENLAKYILDSELDKRITLIDKNKEGIFSLVGYLSIYFAGEAICYRLKYIIKKR